LPVASWQSHRRNVLDLTQTYIRLFSDPYQLQARAVAVDKEGQSRSLLQTCLSSTQVFLIQSHAHVRVLCDVRVRAEQSSYGGTSGSSSLSPATSIGAVAATAGSTAGASASAAERTPWAPLGFSSSPEKPAAAFAREQARFFAAAFACFCGLRSHVSFLVGWRGEEGGEEAELGREPQEQRGVANVERNVSQSLNSSERLVSDQSVCPLDRSFLLRSPAVSLMSRIPMLERQPTVILSSDGSVDKYAFWNFASVSCR
jgi:hypothetical protein